MRIPTPAEFFTIFAVTGKPSDLSTLPGADSKLSLLDEPQCIKGFTVQQGSTCNCIGALHSTPTSDYQIICGNSQINAQCTNLKVNDSLCLGYQGIDCKDIYTAQYPYTNAKSIAEKFNISLEIFQANKYCYKDGDNVKCPIFAQETVVCVAPKSIGTLPRCNKIF